MGDDTNQKRQSTDDDGTNQKKRKLKRTTSYSTMTILEAEKILGISMEYLPAVSVDQMLADAKHGLEQDVILKTKRMVYRQIRQYLQLEGFPSEASPDFNEANVNDLVLYIIGPIITRFKRATGCNVSFRREKEIISTDNETGGREEFLLTDWISVGEYKTVLIIESKRSSTGIAIKQCLLSLKDSKDINGGGVVYGFVTSGHLWKMIRYDGTSFLTTNLFLALFETMETDKKGWLQDYSVVVDCIFCALSMGGIVEE